MGNEQSYGIEIDEKAVEINDYYSQHSATLNNDENVNNLIVFIGEMYIEDPFWSKQTPLERNAKNIMIYRHPCIIKYITSWHKNSKYHLAVEDIIPLNKQLSKLNNLEISIGLYSILKALNFLHNTALVSHNNICINSIYIAKDGNWRLGGMEFLCKYNDLNKDFLKKTTSTRYKKGIDPNEEKLLLNYLNRRDFIDVYAFGVLVNDLFTVNNENDGLLLTNFLEYCKTNLQNPDLSIRPDFKSILEHDFFKNEFIKIHSFLLELPLKTDENKKDFFEKLLEKLLGFPEELIGVQLSALLLSRMVLLDKTAQILLLPALFTPKNGNDEKLSLFSTENFQKFLCPKILDILKVRDIEIRLILLNYFPKYLFTFNKEVLEKEILPELLVGIKDTNDHLVSATLETLALLVPILGSSVVIGGKRAKLFNDGRPIKLTLNCQRSLTETTFLPERPQPDGEEEEEDEDEEIEEIDARNNEIEQQNDDNWEDWDDNNKNDENLNDIEDIKNEEIDYFQDMEPIIESSKKFVINDNEENKLNEEISSKLILNEQNQDLLLVQTGWDEEDW